MLTDIDLDLMVAWSEWTMPQTTEAAQAHVAAVSLKEVVTQVSEAIGVAGMGAADLEAEEDTAPKISSSIHHKAMALSRVAVRTSERKASNKIEPKS